MKSILIFTILSTAISYLSNASAIFPLYAGKEIKNLIWYYCWASLICDIAQLAFNWLSIHHTGIGNLFLVLELLLVGSYLNNEIFRGTMKNLNIWIIGALLCYFTFTAIKNSVFQTNMTGGAIIYAYYLLLILFGFRKILKDLEHIHIQKSSFFLFCVCFFIYVSGASVLLLYDHKLGASNKTLGDNLWTVFLMLNLLKNTTIGYYFVLKKAEN